MVEIVTPELCDRTGRLRPSAVIELLDGRSPLWAELGLGEADVAGSTSSTFVLEAHLRMRAPARAGDRLVHGARLLAHDAKRLHVLLSLLEERSGRMVASYELMVLHVDLTVRRGAPMPEALLERVARRWRADQWRPAAEHAGHRIQIR